MKTSRLILTILTLLLVLTACAGTITFNVEEGTDGSFSGDFDLVLEEDSTPTPPTPNPTPTQEINGLQVRLLGSMNYRESPEIGDNWIDLLPEGLEATAFAWHEGDSYDWLAIELEEHPCSVYGWVAVTGNVDVGGNYERLIQSDAVHQSSCAEGFNPLAFGFNYNASQLGDTEYALRIAEGSCASGHLVMNGLWFADLLFERMVNAGCPEPAIVIREYQQCEGDCYATLTPESVVNSWCDLMQYTSYGDKYFWEAINEPPSNQALLDWSIRVSNYASTQPCGIDFKVAIPAWGVGRVNLIGSRSVDDGFYDELGRVLHQNRDALSVHNYYIGVPASGTGEVSPQLLLAPITTDVNDDSALRDVACPTITDWALDYDPGEFWTRWTIGREWRLIQRWASLGYDNIPVVLTEYGADTLQSYKATDPATGVIRPVNDILRDFYGYDFRGIVSYREYLETLYPDTGYEDTIFKHFTCGLANLPVYDGRQSGYLMAGAFSWTNSLDWVWAGFGLTDTQRLHRLMVDR